MADAIDAEVLEDDIPAGEIEDQEPDQVAAEPPEGEEDEDEVLISFEGDEGSPPQSEKQDSSVIRALREENRRKDAELKALRAQVQPQPQTIEVGEKPTLASCDYDEEAFETATAEWIERKAKAAQAEADARKAEEARQADWNKRLEQVNAQKAELGAKDYDQAAEEVKATFNELQQAMIVKAVKNPAKMIYALGKSPNKAAELAKISDPVELIAELVRLEGKLTVTTQRKAPPPEQTVRGSAPLSKGADKHLERLEAEAAKTGDRTKVVAYKRELKAKARS